MSSSGPHRGALTESSALILLELLTIYANHPKLCEKDGFSLEQVPSKSHRGSSSETGMLTCDTIVE